MLGLHTLSEGPADRVLGVVQDVLHQLLADFLLELFCKALSQFLLDLLAFLLELVVVDFLDDFLMLVYFPVKL